MSTPTGSRYAQHVVTYGSKHGLGRVVYATAYDDADANMQKARCQHRHGAHRDVRIEKADDVPPNSVVAK